MADKKPYTITCPKCSHSMTVELHELINVKSHPETRDLLMKNQVNAVTCPQCNLAFRVDKPLLYSDPDRKFMIHCIPVKEEDYEAGEDQFAKWMQEFGSILPDGIKAPDIHLVFSRIELVERIFMLEAGLNERLIEYIKYIIYSRNSDRVAPGAKAILFNAQDSTPENLCFVVQDLKSRQLESLLNYSRDAYQALRETFSDEEKAADLLEMFPGPYISARTLLLQELPPEEDDEDLEDGERGSGEDSAEDPAKPEGPDDQDLRY